jgi:hypothetical protein
MDFRMHGATIKKITADVFSALCPPSTSSSINDICYYFRVFIVHISCFVLNMKYFYIVFLLGVFLEMRSFGN